jgi:methionine synthase II (cobalamin-independent)
MTRSHSLSQTMLEVWGGISPFSTVDAEFPRSRLNQEALECVLALDASQLWISPDCGLKTRRWDEVRPPLEKWWPLLGEFAAA